jgi:hypothetical protein
MTVLISTWEEFDLCRDQSFAEEGSDEFICFKNSNGNLAAICLIFSRAILRVSFNKFNACFVSLKKYNLFLLISLKL